MTPEERISKLKSAIRTDPKLCIERARLYTQSYMSTEGLPPPLRRAKALEHVLEGKKINIYDGELIIGNPTSKRVAAPILPEVAWKWYTEVMFGLPGDPDESGVLEEDEKLEFMEILKYWDGRSLRDMWYDVIPDEYKDMEGLTWMQGAGNPNAGYYFAHCCPDFERILTKGINGLIAEVDERISRLNIADLDDFQRSIYLKATKISLHSVVIWAERLSAEAAEKAKAEEDPQRKAELEKLAYICHKVPANPAETFYEALQSVWIAYVAVMLEGWGPGLGFGRMDQYLYPYYRRDIDSGEMTKDDIRELLSVFYLKLNELVNPFPLTAGKGGNLGTLSGVTIGGVSRDGTQAAEELTVLFLEAEENVLLYEDIAVRIHHSMSDALVYRACQLATSVRGKIKFLCDETVIKQQMSMGRTFEDAREYASTGCFIHTIPGKGHDPGMDAHNLPMLLELALNNGVTRLQGKKIGAETGDPRNFQTYEDVWNAYKTQVETVIPKCLMGPNYYQRLWAQQLPSPLLSVLYDGCMEKGRDIVDGGTNPYSSVGLWVTGTVNVGDSLAALKKVVFDDKKYTMAQVIDALDKNFEGAEDILFALKNAPKFGNDIDYVDNIVNDVIVNLTDELNKHRGHAGRRYTMACGTVQYNVILGMITGALPDGRKAGEALGEGGISPYQGRNTSGATSTIRSVAKLNLIRSCGGNVLNMKFDPSSTNSHAKMMNFVNLLRTFSATGGDIIQFNIVSNEMLRDAQKHPEQYKDLLVRVATYSAFFVDLPPMGQQEIIDRTSFSSF